MRHFVARYGLPCHEPTRDPAPAVVPSPRGVRLTEAPRRTRAQSADAVSGPATAGGPLDDAHATKERLFWALAERLLGEPPVTRSTMMGFPCMRFDGRFFASIDRDSKDLVVKLPAARVEELIASGQGTVFAPNRRVFREWVAVPVPDRDLWTALLEESKAYAIVSGPEGGRHHRARRAARSTDH